MAHLPIPDTLEARLQRIATRYGLSLTRFLERVADDYGADAPVSTAYIAPIQQPEIEVEKRKAFIAKEQATYEEQHLALYKKYADQYVAMRDGIVIDFDSDKIALKERLREKFGKQPVFVTLVRPEALQTIWVRGPRFITNSPELHYTNSSRK